MPLLDLLYRYHTAVVYYWNQPGTKRIATALVLLFSFLLMYRRIQRAREQELLLLNRRNNNNNNIANTTAVNTGNRSTNSSAAKNNVPAISTPAKRYLQPNPTQSTVILATNHILFNSDNSFNTSTVPILIALATHTNLYFLTVINELDKNNAITCQLVESSLQSAGIFEAGLKKHRLLYCSSIKGKQSVYRHLEPSLCIDDNEEILQQLKPFIPDCVLIQPNSTLRLNQQLLSYSTPNVQNKLIAVPSLELYFLGTNAQPTNTHNNNNLNTALSASINDSKSSVNSPGLSLVKSHPSAQLS
jgi:hypothetical protein